MSVSRRRFLQVSGATLAAMNWSFEEAHASTSITEAPTSGSAITPFESSIPKDALVELKRRLDATRWPERETVNDWTQGAPLARVQALVEHWRTRYDWRRFEHELNALPQFRTEIDGLGIHFIHVKSKHANALPMILTHGWPGSIVEFLKTIRPLTDPTSYRGQASDAFHVVIPSLPGYGFSDKPKQSGWGAKKTAAAWAQLMSRLGYERYVAQGGDWGAAVTTSLGHLRPHGLVGIHLNMLFVVPRVMPKTLSNGEQAALDALSRFGNDGFGYAKIQATRPQTIGYGLVDSPVALAAFIYEKFAEWSDSDRTPEKILGLDAMLDDIMLYWLPGTGASAARMYWENSKIDFTAVAPIEIPVGCSIFPHELYRAPLSWAKLAYPNLAYWNELDRGGHFAAMEQPEIFVNELRSCFRKMR